MVTRAAKLTRVPRHKIIGASQEFAPCAIRCAIYLALRKRNMTVWTYSNLGRVFARDHSTIISAIENRRRYSQRYSWFEPLVTRLGEPEEEGEEPFCRWHPI